MSDMASMPRWIPVAARLPKEYETVLVATDGGVSAGEVRFPDGECGRVGLVRLSEVTHWMPLPAPPTAAKQPSAASGGYGGSYGKKDAKQRIANMSEDTPDAYGLLDEGEVHYATPFRDEAEMVLRRTNDKDSVIVPLYRKPPVAENATSATLTDAEREAIAVAANHADWCDKEIDGVRFEASAVLRGLLERTK